jgi:hypothetical protein
MEREHGDLAVQARFAESDNLLETSEALRAKSRELRARSQQAREISIALRARCSKREIARRVAITGTHARRLALRKNWSIGN